MREARININLMSREPIRGFSSLPCQKLYILLLVDAYIFNLATEIRPALKYNPRAKIVPMSQPLIANCTRLFKI